MLENHFTMMIGHVIVVCDRLSRID